MLDFYVHILGAFCVIASCTGIGIYAGSSRKDRLEKLRAVRQHFSMLEGDIRCGFSTLPEALSNLYMRLEKGTFSEMELFYKTVADRLFEREGKTLQEIWSGEANRCLSGSSLTKEDIRLFSALGGQLGCLDRDMQLTTIDLYMSRLEEEIGRQAETIGETMRLCRTLGLLAGIFIVVVVL